MKTAAALAAVALLCVCADAHAQSSSQLQRTLPEVIRGAPKATSTEIGNGYVPLTSGGALKKIPGTEFITQSGTGEFTNKTIDCSKNTCLNFPGGGETGSGVPITLHTGATVTLHSGRNLTLHGS